MLRPGVRSLDGTESTQIWILENQIGVFDSLT